MKQATTLLLLIIVLFSCKKGDVNHPKPQACVFGVENPFAQKRVNTGHGKKPVDTVVVTPPPPSIQNCILIDGDGQDVSGTSWNYDGPITCTPSGLSDGDLSLLLDRVKRDYSPFNVVVTTSEATYLTFNQYHRARVIVTQTHEWYGNNAGGVSYIGSFTWGDETPAFVFSDLLGFNVKYIADAVSHEAGHTVGLFHQAKYDDSCNLIAEYSDGGSSATAPIMGFPYFKPATWWIGPTAYGCDKIQNDSLIISQTLK